MAENSGFFDAHIVGDEYDRVYLAEHFARYFSSFIGNGVFGGRLNSLMVVAMDVDSMKVVVKSGQAWINGYWYENDSDKQLTIGTADGVLNRIDAIVVRYTTINRSIETVVKRGTPAASAVAPSMQRDADVWELCLAQVKVGAGAIKIVSSNITDTRMNTSLCGQVTGAVKQIDTSVYGAQLNRFIERYMAKAEQDYQDKYIATLDDLKSRARLSYDEFVSWLASLKDNTNNQVLTFLTWLSSYKLNVIAEVSALEQRLQGLIDSEVASVLAERITELEKQKPTVQVASINHGLEDYPHCDLYEYTYGYGIGGAGEGPAGGGSLVSVPNFEYEMPNNGNVKIRVRSRYGAVEAVNKIDTGLYAIVFSNNTTSLIAKLS